jgi:peptidoglycan hydrolase-like protein with peptidoglycan-binding domain
VHSFRASVAFLLTAALIATPAFASRIHRAPTSGHAASHSRSTHKSALPKGVKASKISKSHKMHGQQSIDPARVTQIQQALIREHYMTGEATGQWDATTASAMQKYQADQGWQTKLMPDSRAIKKLGLGPDYSGAINAKGASFASPTPANSLPPSQSAAFASAAGVSQ